MDAQVKEALVLTADADMPADLGAGTTDHPLISIPFTAEIDGRQYKGSGLSLVRAEVFGLMDPALAGATRLVRLSFLFQGFTVLLGVECRLDPTPGAQGKVVLTFTDPTGEHLPQLRHVLNSFVAGDLVTMGQFLAVSSVKPASGKPVGAVGQGPGGFGQIMRRVVGTVSLLALTVLLVGAVGTLGYKRFFVTPVATPARILPDGQSLTAVSAGQIDYINTEAAKGEVAYTIRAVSGQMLSMAMPCDCVGLLAGPQVGDTLQAGEVVMLIHATDAPLVIHASVPGTDLFKLTSADHINAALADGTQITARLADATALRPALSADADVSVVLVPDAPIAPERLGQIARLSIVQPLPPLLSSLADLPRAFGN